MHILLVEDDALLGDGVQAGLEVHGFSVAWVPDAGAAEAALAGPAFDLVILDLGLPDRDGLGLLRHWRRQAGMSRCSCSPPGTAWPTGWRV